MSMLTSSPSTPAVSRHWPASVLIAAATILSGCTLGAGHAPPPFSAALLQAANAEGSEWVLRTVTPSAPPSERRLRLRGQGTDALLVAGPAGAEPPGPRPLPVTWQALEEHAHYPENGTEIVPEVVTVPAGTFRCLRYTVPTRDGARLQVWFAARLPGPPVLQVLSKGGVELERTELVDFAPR